MQYKAVNGFHFFVNTCDEENVYLLNRKTNILQISGVLKITVAPTNPTICVHIYPGTLQ